RNSDQAAALVRPSEPRIAISIIRRDRSRLDARPGAGLGQSDPGDAVATVAHHYLTDFAKQDRLFARVHEHLVAVADCPQRAIRTLQILLGALAVGDVLNLRHEVARRFFIVDDKRGIKLHPANPAILVTVALHATDGLDFAVEQTLCGNPVTRYIEWMGHRLVSHRQQFLRRVADDRAQRRV